MNADCLRLADAYLRQLGGRLWRRGKILASRYRGDRNSAKWIWTVGLQSSLGFRAMWQTPRTR